VYVTTGVDPGAPVVRSLDQHGLVVASPATPLVSPVVPGTIPARPGDTLTVDADGRVWGIPPSPPGESVPTTTAPIRITPSPSMFQRILGGLGLASDVLGTFGTIFDAASLSSYVRGESTCYSPTPIYTMCNSPRGLPEGSRVYRQTITEPEAVYGTVHLNEHGESYIDWENTPENDFDYGLRGA
jgi:hypothetical protein